MPNACMCWDTKLRNLLSFRSFHWIQHRHPQQEGRKWWHYNVLVLPQHWWQWILHCLQSHHEMHTAWRHATSKRTLRPRSMIVILQVYVKRRRPFRRIWTSRRVQRHSQATARFVQSLSSFWKLLSNKFLSLGWIQPWRLYFRGCSPDSEIAKQFSCKRTKASYVVSDVLGPYFRKLVICELQRPNVFYSIAIDETPLLEQCCQQLDVMVRYFSLACGCGTSSVFQVRLSYGWYPSRWNKKGNTVSSTEQLHLFL